MKDTITTCLLDANDYIYIVINNKINSLQPLINLLEFGESITNISIFIAFAFFLYLLYSIKGKISNINGNYKFAFGLVLTAAVLLAVSFMYHKHEISEVEAKVAKLEQKMALFSEPSAEIMKLCTESSTMLGRDGSVKIIRNKDDSPSTFSVLENKTS